ncbi:tRNA lysidine(34) synthetase TilS [Paenactinomyces guangxiensis]|uniref:tRNA(Ile)-lysidine synthase n=1 Tax=Paenactinomyces guangxiensis TaxID=1490290 RepID=A0A7W1WTJ6_9BACL|nr:tRNA lysidine(34) synthetase TilS [Paenactinomyces guangxiensis]MBA4495805.1 tRNA lysidine(34) synthetase TilS [Paenactinomyces guangxiensis]MBH8592895.1 tRNA lysidine(34) synthetase TilS [Paenactinomyces guangxiensis]
MFLELLKQEIEQHQLLKQGETVLVGVSGGPDSIALLHGLHQLSPDYGWSLFVIHVNHQLRGKESDEDAHYVEDCCEKWNIPCRIERVDVSGVIAAGGGNKQATARRLRYEAFQNAAESFNADKLALAHHADDQAETILMRFIRGTGVAGLKGMDRVRSWNGIQLIRPLLGISRQEIESYCAERDLHPRFDQSNLSLTYTRNQVRLQLIPMLTTYNPQVKEAILQLSEVVREEEKVWDQLVQDAFKEILVKKSDSSITLDVSSFLHFPVALQRRIVKLILSCLLRQGTSEATLDSIEQVRKVSIHKNPSVSIDLPGRIKVEREYQLLRIKVLGRANGQKQEKAGAEPVVLSVPGVTSLPGFVGRIEIIVSDQPIHSLQPCRDWTVFDAEKIRPPLLVRSRRPGDRMTCYGLNGTKKLKNLFIDAKIPRQSRDSYPIVTADEDIIWVPGVRRSNKAIVTPETKHFLYCLWYTD